VHDYVRSEVRDLGDLPPDHAETQFAALESQADEDLAGEGLGGRERHFIRELDLRYSGQGYEIRTPLDGIDVNPVTAASLTEIAARFHELHQTLHGHSAPDQAIEVVSYRVRVRAPVPKQDLPALDGLSDEAAASKGTRSVTFDGRSRFEAPVYDRDALTAAAIEGPAVIEQFDSTTVLPPGWTARLDHYGNIVAERES